MNQKLSEVFSVFQRNAYNFECMYRHTPKPLRYVFFDFISNVCMFIISFVCICWLKVSHSDRECSYTFFVQRLHLLSDFNDMRLSYECSGIRFVRESRFGSIRSQCTSLILSLISGTQTHYQLERASSSGPPRGNKG